jgi:hypothetical protein
MSDLPYRYPISISHIDLPIISCHSNLALTVADWGPTKTFRRLPPSILTIGRKSITPGPIFDGDNPPNAIVTGELPSDVAGGVLIILVAPKLAY